MSHAQEKTMAQAPVKQSTNNLHKLFDEAASSTYDDVKAIVDARIELLKIDLTEKIAIAGASVILAVILILGLSYLITTIAWFLGEMLGHAFLGFLIISLLFFIIFWFFAKFKPSLLKNLIQNLLLSLHDYTK